MYKKLLRTVGVIDFTSKVFSHIKPSNSTIKTGQVSWQATKITSGTNGTKTESSFQTKRQ